MRLKEYLWDRIYLILFYLLLMFFISLVFYLSPGPNRDVMLENILYINFVALTFFALYLLRDYLVHKKYYKSISYIGEGDTVDFVNSLPEPKTHEQAFFNRLFVAIHHENSRRIEHLHQENKENLEYITSWVHEVKTPIAVSRLEIENSREKAKGDILDSIEEELDKIEAHVDKALYYSRIDAFSNDYMIGEVRLGKVVKEVVKKHAKTFISRKINVQIGELTVEVLTDKKWLYFILDQIIANSLKYTDKGGTISIQSESSMKEKRLIIEDNGIGIKPEDLRRVFEKGFTGHLGREEHKSTGMGLYLAKRLARKLSHDISVESVYGEYTRMIIHFPHLKDYFKVT